MEFSNLMEQAPTGNDSPEEGMTLAEACRVLNAEVLCGIDRLHDHVYTACGCDLMSDVLAFTRPGSLLLTGLTNNQVVRTAEILDLKGIVFVRNKRPDSETIRLAKECGIPLFTCPHPLFESCGMLYAKGLKGCTHIE